MLVDGTVRRSTGPWSPAVHALLDFLERRRFAGSPRVLGLDSQGREVLSYLPGETVGESRPWPAWAHSDAALRQVGDWLRRYHDTVRAFRPPQGAAWRLGTRPWCPGDVIAHNDAAPYNAVWQPHSGTGGRLVGFIDWDFASPQPAVWDLAYTVFSWVPLHARHVVAEEGFTDFAGRPRRLRMLLDAYGWHGTVEEVLEAVAARVAAHIEDVRELAARDPLFARLVDAGVTNYLNQALTELAWDHAELATGR